MAASWTSEWTCPPSPLSASLADGSVTGMSTEQALIAQLHMDTHYRVLQIVGTKEYFVVDLERGQASAGKDDSGILHSTGRKALSERELRQEIEKLLGEQRQSAPPPGSG